MAFQYLILLSFLFLPLVPTDAGHPSCPPYTVYMTCGKCEGTCDNPKPPCSGCKPPGCYCIEGYVRAADRSVIHISQCPPRTSKSPTRPPTTKRPILTTPTKPHVTIPDCPIGPLHDPKPPTTRRPIPPIIPPHVSTRPPIPPRVSTRPTPRPTPPQPRCPRYEIYLKYGACEGRCPGKKPIKNKLCKAPGCYCPKQDGYLRDARGRCIPKWQCPRPPRPKCRWNEFWKKCVRCEKYCEKDPRPCRKPCRPKCACKKGFVRTWDGKRCMRKKYCSPHPDCRKIKCPSTHKCVWKPRWCHPKSPCVQVQCVPYYKSDKSDKSD